MKNSSGRVKNGFILLIASALGGAAAWLLMGWFKTIYQDGWKLTPAWKTVILEKFGEGVGRRIIWHIRQEYGQLLSGRFETAHVPVDGALRQHYIRKILPGLALYRVLLRDGGLERQDALAVVDRCLRAELQASSRFLMVPFKILPEPFWLFRRAFGLRMQAFPAAGWDTTYLENNDSQVALKITRCYYLDTLTSLGAPELTASFCKTDLVMAEMFPASIRFEREQTLADGGSECDFRYCAQQTRMTFKF